MRPRSSGAALFAPWLGGIPADFMRKEDAFKARQQKELALRGKLFKYHKWLATKKISPDVEDIVDDYKNAKNEDVKYKHIDIMQEYLNSWKADIEKKDSVQTMTIVSLQSSRSTLRKDRSICDQRTGILH